jgi:Transcriptional regulator, AbiEi antitoxin/Protein of unknown function (DUF559)/AbiEi antitoxin C-terminal domain
VAAAQHGVFPLAQVVDLGLSDSSARRRVSAGRLHRVYPGVYSLVPPSLLTARGRYLAAVFACGPTAALSHRSAAALHGLRRSSRARIEVTVPGRTTRRHPGIEVHRSIRLEAAVDVTGVDTVPVTTVARTLLDLAAVVPRRALERALDQAEILRVFDLNALRDQLARNPGHPGAGKLRSTLARHTAGDAVTESELEELFRAIVDPAGLPRPEVNAPVDPGDGGMIIRPDVVWRDAKLAVELDGAKWHLTRTAFETDHDRDLRLKAAGWDVIRLTWRQLHDEPTRVTALLQTKLG